MNGAYGLKPQFSDLAGYRRWRVTWKRVNARLMRTIQTKRRALVLAQRCGSPAMAALQSELHFERVMAAKLMGLLQDGRARAARIHAMKRAMVSQQARFPLTFEAVRSLEFHYNKASTEFTDLPPWTVKAHGETFYVPHVDFVDVSFSTRERDTGASRGVLRVRQCRLHIDAQGTAQVSPRLF